MRDTQAQATRPVGRLAPSPTGRLHLGHARTFLLAWWQVRARGGRIVLRIEDLDRDRCRPEYTDELLRDLEWLGLDWDGPVRVQSRDTSAMESACDTLLARGLAYPCVCTRAEIEALSAPNAGDVETRYPGTCRGRWSTLADAHAASGREPAVRIGAPPGPIALDDGFAGRHTFDVQREAGDFVVRRRDGSFAYQLAVVVDDAVAEVDTILRGDDLLPSAARQWWLQEKLSLPHPRWFHVPLVLDAGGGRLAKRRGDPATLTALRTSGVDARAVVAWAARSSGQRSDARMAAADVLRDFDLALVPHDAVRVSAADWRELSSRRSP